MKTKLNNHLRSFGLIFLGLMLVFLSCNRSDLECDPTAGLPANCNDIEPTTGELSLELSVGVENPAVAIAVYYDYIEDSILYFRDTITSRKVIYDVPISTRYTVVAKYAVQGRTIYAIDGGKVKLKSNDDCGYTCYTVDDLDLNLQLAN